MTERVIIAGFGGQGVMTMGKLFASAAMREGREATYVPCYGPEVRGGTAHCHVVISDEPIYSPWVEEATALLLFNQLSYEKFRNQLGDGGLVVLNSSLVMSDPASGARRARPVPADPGDRRRKRNRIGARDERHHARRVLRRAESCLRRRRARRNGANGAGQRQIALARYQPPGVPQGRGTGRGLR